MPTTPPLFEGLQVITAAEDSISINIGGGLVGAVVTNGSYFLRDHTGTPADTNQLLQRFVTAVNTVGAITGVYDADTGLVTLAETGGNITTIQFDDHTGAGIIDVGVMLGLLVPESPGAPSIVIAANTTVSGVVEPYYVWRPNIAPVDLLGDISLAGVRRSDAVTTVAPGGRVVTTKYWEQTIQGFIFEYIDDEEALPLDDTIVSYEDIARRIFSTGQQWRYYPERDDLDGPTGTGPFVYVANQATATNLSTSLGRTITRSTDLYNQTVGCHLYVAEP